MRIEAAKISDLGAIQSCAEAAYQIYISRIGQKPAPMVADFKTQITEGLVFVSFDDQDSFIGFIVAYPKEHVFFIENIALLPTSQGNGFGKRMFTWCEQKAREMSLGVLELYTNEKMTENLGLYQRIGFIETDRRVEDGFSRVYFRKTL